MTANVGGALWRRQTVELEIEKQFFFNEVIVFFFKEII